MTQFTENEMLLLQLSEECSEIIQRISKCFRFGHLEVQEGKRVNNIELVAQEIDDFQALVAMLRHNFMLRHLDMDAQRAKVAKVRKWMAYSREQGTVK